MAEKLRMTGNVTSIDIKKHTGNITGLQLSSYVCAKVICSISVPLTSLVHKLLPEERNGEETMGVIDADR